MKQQSRPQYPTTGFLSFQDKLNEALRLSPQVIKDSDFDLSRSGNELMMHTFQAYDLVDDDGQVTPFFRNLAASDEPTRRRMLRDKAAELFSEFVSMAQREDASQQQLIESLDLLYGIKGSTAEKMVNHYNGSSLMLGLPRCKDMPIMRGYKKRNPTLRPRPLPARPATEVGFATPQSQPTREAVEHPPTNDADTTQGGGSGQPAPGRDMLARHYKMKTEYAELLLRALRNTVERGDVPTEELLERIDHFIGAGRAELPNPSSQGGIG